MSLSSGGTVLHSVVCAYLKLVRTMVSTVFSVPAFFLVLREVLEACLVIGLVMAYLRKTGATQLTKWVWWAAGLGIGISLTLGLTFSVIFYVKKLRLFEGKGGKIFEGVIFLVAAGLLTWMVIWIAVMGKRLQLGLEERLQGFVEEGGSSGKWGIFSMVFVHTLREGIETFIFLFGAASAGDTGDGQGWRGVILPGVLAVVVGITISYGLFRGILLLDILQFFFWSSVILMAFSAGLTSHAFHELQEADWFGVWGEDTSLRPWWNYPMWDSTGCCNDKSNQFFGFLRTLFGYQDKPTFIEWITYWLYWLAILITLTRLNWVAIRENTNLVASLTKQTLLTSLLVSLVAFVYSLANVTWHGLLVSTLLLVISFVAIFGIYDSVTTRIPGLPYLRRVISLSCAIALAIVTCFMQAVHFAQMACLPANAKCNLKPFYYVGLIFDQDWVNSPRGKSGWIPLAVLNWSLVITFVFYGGLAFGMFVFSGNIDEEGNYRYDIEKTAADENQVERGVFRDSTNTSVHI